MVTVAVRSPGRERVVREQSERPVDRRSAKLRDGLFRALRRTGRRGSFGPGALVVKPPLRVENDEGNARRRREEERPGTAPSGRVEKAGRAARQEPLLPEDGREAVLAHLVPVVVARKEENARSGAECCVRLGGETALALPPLRVFLAGKASRVEVVSQEDDQRVLRVFRGLGPEGPKEGLVGGGCSGIPREEKRLYTLGKRARWSHRRL